MVNCLGIMVTTTASPGMFVLRNDGGALVSVFFALASVLFAWESALGPSASASFKDLSAFPSVVAVFPATSPASAKGTDAQGSGAVWAEFSRGGCNGCSLGLLEVSFSVSSSRNSLEYSSGPMDFLKASKYRYLVLDLILAPWMVIALTSG